jgi:hypothetical protein
MTLPHPAPLVLLFYLLSSLTSLSNTLIPHFSCQYLQPSYLITLPLSQSPVVFPLIHVPNLSVFCHHPSTMSSHLSPRISLLHHSPLKHHHSSISSLATPFIPLPSTNHLCLLLPNHFPSCLSPHISHLTSLPSSLSHHASLLRTSPTSPLIQVSSSLFLILFLGPFYPSLSPHLSHLFSLPSSLSHHPSSYPRRLIHIPTPFLVND